MGLQVLQDSHSRALKGVKDLPDRLEEQVYLGQRAPAGSREVAA